MSDTVDHEARGLAQAADAKADMALRQLDSHEKICAERYQGIRDSISDTKALIDRLGDQYSGGINRVHDRIDQGQKRLILGLGAVALLLAGGLGTVVFFMITKTS